MSVLHLNEAQFESTISNGVVLVDFWAGWCGPCKMLAPTIEELASKYDGKAVVAKVDIDEEANLAAKFGIMSIPTVVLFKDGAELTRIVGVQPIDAFEQIIDSSL